jgi:Zn-dependent peptidase ImmA (M78 family)/transcriptional regulator with XRE-family HTH domain
MMPPEHINPRILSWARETAGLSVTEAAEKLGLKDSAKATAAEKLLALESGQRPPGQTTLQKAVSVYRRPLIAFYRAEPPARGDRGEDFRTAKSASARANGALDALLRDVRARQQMLRQVLEDEEEARLQPFVGSVRIEHGVGRVAAALRTTLEVSEEQQRQCRGSTGLFAFLRSAVERTGVYVLLLGDVGSHHSDIGEDVFRGFALADQVAPFVVINDNDAVTARSFTLMHELAHVWLGASGISGPLHGVPDNVIESFCNDVASEFLLPHDQMPDLSALRGENLAAAIRAIERIADAWNVSQPAVAYRFARNGWIDHTVASRLFAMFADRWRLEKRHARESRQADDSGPSYYIVRRHRLGAALLGVVRRALQGEILTHTRAAKILGVSPASVAPLLHERLHVT